MKLNRFPFTFLITVAGLLFLTKFVASTTCYAEKPKTQKQTKRRHTSKNVTAYRDVVYATVGDKEILLDLYVPKNTAVKPPLLVWIHGGGWQAGSKDSCRLYRETQRGYAVASLNYRLSHDAMFPAQIHDCKGAIRWLRANAEKFGYNADRIGVAGSSAGGQLVALLGTSGGVKELEGNVGGNLDQSSAVQAVCDFYGATNFHTIIKQRKQVKSRPSSALTKLFGGTVEEKPEIATLASPVTFLDKTDPPFLLIHGGKDNIVPVEQSTSFEKLLKQVNVPVTLLILEEAGHGGRPFNSKETNQRLQSFFDKHIKKMD